MRAAAILGLLAVLACAACASAVRLPRQAIDLNTAGAQALLRGDLSAAEACLSVALEYSPRFVEAWVNLGYVELRRGNFEQARRDFARGRDLNQDIPAPHHALGLLAEKSGRGEEAERYYRAALKVDQGSPPREPISHVASLRVASTRMPGSSSSASSTWRRTRSPDGRGREKRCCNWGARPRPTMSWRARVNVSATRPH